MERKREALLASVLTVIAGTLIVSLTASRPVEATDIEKADGATDASAEHVVVSRREFKTDLERSGTFVPVEYEVIRLRPEEPLGALSFVEVLPHGTLVSEGDVVARIDERALTRQIQATELELQSATIRHRNAVEKAGIDREAAANSLGDARANLARARRALQGFEKHELEFRTRQAEISNRSWLDNMEDQKDELAQLESMYRDDELVDATEEIVLKRARRGLARTQASHKLNQDRRRYDVDYSEANEAESRRQQVATQEKTVERMVRSHRIAERAREDGLVRSEDGMRKVKEKLERMQRGLELLTVRAPRSGILLHGSPDDYRPGRVSPRHEVYGQAAPTQVLFTVADPDKLAVALDVPESRMDSVRAGMGAEVHPVIRPETTLVGTLHHERFPSPRSAASAENVYEGTIRIAGSTTGYVPGMRVKAHLVTEKLPSAVVLPASAIFGDASLKFCYVLTDNGAYRRVEVELGPKKGNEVVVKADLADGSKVLLCEPK